MTETPDRILRLKTVLERTGLSRSTMYRKMQNGSFPKNVRISTRYAGWRESAVNEWMCNLIFYEASNQQQG
jgi:prophage regulatory protein